MLDLTADVIDVRDIITTIEKLRKDKNCDEVLLTQLIFIMKSIENKAGGDEQWKGKSYPAILAAKHIFTEYNKNYTEIMINNNTYYTLRR